MICIIAFAVGDSLGSILTLIGVLAWTTVMLTLIYMFLFKDFMTRIKESWSESLDDTDAEDQEVAVAVAVTKVDKDGSV